MRQATSTRRGYLDWLRGLAVLIMIEAHIVDSWTRLDEREKLGPKDVALAHVDDPV